jgi:methionyl aminopeptidase
MSILNATDLEGLIRAGRVVNRILRELAARARAGVTTGDLDGHAASILAATGARSAPREEYGFPGACLLSINDEAVHGVPQAGRVLARGDVLKIDVTVELDGYVADAAVTVALAPVAPEVEALVAGTAAALERALEVARAGVPVAELGAAIADEASRHDLRVIRSLCGHGVGRRIHEPPVLPNYFDPESRDILTEGLVVAIEPILTTGSGRVVKAADGWTIRTEDGAPAAHFEHTVAIGRGRPRILA